jgi:hypothetical protein
MMFKGKNVQAIQWDGTNDDALFDFCGSFITVTERDEVYIHREGRLSKSDYIVRVGSVYKILSKSDFEAMFE